MPRGTSTGGTSCARSISHAQRARRSMLLKWLSISRRVFLPSLFLSQQTTRIRRAALREARATAAQPPPTLTLRAAPAATMRPSGHQTHFNCSGHFQDAPRGSLGPQETTKR